MAAVSAWGKPGAWALESEEHEAAAALDQQQKDKGYSSSDSHQSSSSDFPSLSAALTAKIPKKKKKQTLTLAEFTTGKFQPSAKTPTTDELLVLPTGPRERSAEELERSRGFRYDGRREGGRNGEDSSDRRRSRVPDESRRGPGREPRDSGPSRADEVDDWGATKKSVVNPERRERERGFFDSQSRADESESWFSKKGSVLPVSEERRERRGFDLFNKEGSNGSGVDSDNWGKKREENVGSGRPRLVLQPRTLPVVNGSNGEEKKGTEAVKSKGANPFGEARPREEVLKEKGKDWKEIDEKLEAVKIQEGAPPVGRKGFGMGNGLKEDRMERAWRKPDMNEATSSPRSSI